METSAEEKKILGKPLNQVDNATADKIFLQSIEQLRTSRRSKTARFEQIRENEDLYLGVITNPSIRNPFGSECFPYMAGFVDHLKSKIDDDSTLSFSSDDEADYKKTQRIQAFYDKVSKSVAPNDSWDLKHRYAKTNSIFSGVATYKYFATDEDGYKSYLEVISHYDFHNEPRGGGQIENHLFCGQDNIFKTEEELKENKQYDQTQVAKLLNGYSTNSWKDNQDFESTKNSKFAALGQQPETNNYVGQNVIKMVEWYTTYKGKRYYMLFNERSLTWVRCVLLVTMFEDNMWPYICWHTNEDPDIFWSKAPADDARRVANLINRFLHQELYNREKENNGRELFDAEMVPNLAQLTDTRPDAKIAIDTKGGSRALTSAVTRLSSGALNGTLDLITWLETFTGKQLGYTSSSAGQSENDKKVGVFEGEIAQIEELIGVKNKSFRLALSILGLKFKTNAEQRIDKEISVKVMGAKGVEWVKMTPDDFKTAGTLTIQPIGGTSELKLKEIQKNKKLNSLSLVQSVNPQWKDRQYLLLTGFTEEDVKEAFSSESFAEKELMSEAAMAEKEIVEGKTPKPNRGATNSFMQHIIDFAVNTDDLPIETFKKLIAYAESHVDIVLENMNRSAKEMIAKRAKIKLSTGISPENLSGIINANGQTNVSNGGGASPEISGAGQLAGNIPPGGTIQ